MVSMNKHTNLMKIVIVLFVPYIFDFIFLPLIFPDFKSDVFMNISSIFAIVFSILSMAFLTDKLRYWLLSDIVYFLLAMLYHPPEIFGIGLPYVITFPVANQEPLPYDRNVAWKGILFCVIENLLIQFAVWLCIKLFKTVRAYLKKKKSAA